MYDQDTVALIHAMPSLDGLDRRSLPDLLTETFAQIAATRIRLRDHDDKEPPEELAKLFKQMRRLAYTNEALVSALPERDDRSAAAYVAASAHQLCLNADRLFNGNSERTFVGIQSISSDIAAMLLFMAAEATSDAGEISKTLTWQPNNAIEVALITSLRDLARGKLLALTGRSIPSREAVTSEDPAVSAVRSLYRAILEGVHVLANQVLLGDLVDDIRDPVAMFQHICTLSIGPNQNVSEDWVEMPTSTFPGPHHLASLLTAISKDLAESAVTNIPSPPGVNLENWSASMRRIAKSRPFLWRNHRNAIEQGYLRPGTSAAVSFPTGAGKSTLAELKINTALLADKNVIFLAPTHALVDQTSLSLSRS
nr:hypothetical protein [Spirochaetales bacterium]